MKVRRSLLAVTVMASALGCDASDSYDTPTADEYDEIATATAQTMVNDSGGDTESMRVAVAVSSSGELPSGFEGEPTDFEATFAGVLYGYTLECISADGAETDCGSQTDGSRSTVSWGGALDSRRFDAAFDRQGQWELTGLSTGRPVFNGTSIFSIETRFDGVWFDRESSWRFEYEAQYTDVALEPVLLLPMTGEISYTLYADRFAQTNDDTVESTFRVQVEIGFVSPGVARLVLDGQYAYAIDLDTGELTPDAGPG